MIHQTPPSELPCSCARGRRWSSGRSTDWDQDCQPSYSPRMMEAGSWLTWARALCHWTDSAPWRSDRPPSWWCPRSSRWRWHSWLTSTEHSAAAHPLTPLYHAHPSQPANTVMWLVEYKALDKYWIVIGQYLWHMCCMSLVSSSDQRWHVLISLTAPGECHCVVVVVVVVLWWKGRILIVTGSIAVSSIVCSIKIIGLKVWRVCCWSVLLLLLLLLIWWFSAAVERLSGHISHQIIVHNTLPRIWC